MKRNDQNNNHENYYNTIAKLNGQTSTIKKGYHHHHVKKLSKSSRWKKGFITTIKRNCQNHWMMVEGCRNHYEKTKRDYQVKSISSSALLPLEVSHPQGHDLNWSTSRPYYLCYSILKSMDNGTWRSAIIWQGRVMARSVFSLSKTNPTCYLHGALKKFTMVII